MKAFLIQFNLMLVILYGVLFFTQGNVTALIAVGVTLVMVRVFGKDLFASIKVLCNITR